jgi:hypothetical protein
MYHTYYNDASNLQGYGYTSNGTTPTQGTWTYRGCSSSGSTVNGITCNGSILFYAPLELGPGSPNTVYYGADRLYRSDDRGLTHTVVSQNPITSGVPISAIGISSQDDNVRIVGLRNGDLYGTTSGASTLVNLDPNNNVPATYIARAVIDPRNKDVAYVTMTTFAAQSTIWKTSNLSSPTPTWTAASSGMPQVPVNAFVVDPLDSNLLYAGTDIGVYMSNDAGASWNPIGTGLPRVAVFDIVVLPKLRKIRIATHGRGMWELSLPTVYASLSGRIMTSTGAGLRNATVTLTDPQNNVRTVLTSSLGYYQFDNVASLETYSVGVRSKRFRFTARNLVPAGAMGGVDFTGQE